MDWQQPVALVIVAAAAIGLARRRRRDRRFTFDRETPCGCGSPTDPPLSSIVFHARKNGRSSITVKNR